MKTLRRLFAFLSVSWGAGAMFILLATWATAYMQGGSVLVLINSYGEMQIELVALCIMIPIFIVGLYYTLEMIFE